MDISVIHSLFQNDDFTRVEVQLEPRQVALLKAFAARRETSFDQALRYLINVGAQHAVPAEIKKNDDGDDDGGSVFDQFRSIAHRIEKLQAKKESTEPREMHEVLKQMLTEYQKTNTSSSRSDASPASNGKSESESDASGPPSMFDIANEIGKGDSG